MKRLYALFFAAYTVLCVWTLLKHDMFMSVAGRMLFCFIAALLTLSLIFIIGHKRKRYDIVDVGWGLAFMAIAVTGFLLQGGMRFVWDVQTLVTAMVILWALRLSLHIGQRFLRSKQEDQRYVELRKNWQGNLAKNTFFRVYVVQAALALAVAIPVIHINLQKDIAWNWFMYVGVAVWLVGFLCEAFADFQLKNFLANPKNKGTFIRTGLWKYARHPNYFGELLVWWGFAILSLGTPHGWVGLGGAAAITYLIIYISGVPPKEARMRKRPGWATYVRHTRQLLPVPKLHF